MKPVDLMLLRKRISVHRPPYPLSPSMCGERRMKLPTAQGFYEPYIAAGNKITK